MAAGNWIIPNTTKKYLVDGTMDLDTSEFKMALFLSTATLTLTMSVYGDATNQVANGFGYTTGGVTCTITVAQASTTTTVNQSGDVVWTAATSSIVARSAMIYMNATVNSINKPVLCYCALDSSDVTATEGNTLTIKNPAAGIFTITGAVA